MYINELSVNIILRFRMFPLIVCDNNKTLWQLEDKTGKRFKPLRKLTFDKSKNAFRINNVWVTRKRLLNLREETKEKIIITKGFEYPF